MDFLLVRRRRLTEPPAPFRCACGTPIVWTTTTDRLTAQCCERAVYLVLRDEPTGSADARELVIAARGVVQKDLVAFELQGFHALVPAGARFFPDVPTIRGELTHPDGSIKTEREI